MANNSTSELERLIKVMEAALSKYPEADDVKAAVVVLTGFKAVHAELEAINKRLDRIDELQFPVNIGLTETQRAKLMKHIACPCLECSGNCSCGKLGHHSLGHSKEGQ